MNLADEIKEIIDDKRDGPASEAAKLRYINNTPKVLSLLWDLDLMPEQLEHGSRNWHRMMQLACWICIQDLKTTKIDTKAEADECL